MYWLLPRIFSQNACGSKFYLVKMLNVALMDETVMERQLTNYLLLVNFSVTKSADGSNVWSRVYLQQLDGLAVLLLSAQLGRLDENGPRVARILRLKAGRQFPALVGLQGTTESGEKGSRHCGLQRWAVEGQCERSSAPGWCTWPAGPCSGRWPGAASSPACARRPRRWSALPSSWSQTRFGPVGRAWVRV